MPLSPPNPGNVAKTIEETMTQHQAQAIIAMIERLRPSSSGNPRYKCVVQIDDPRLQTHGYALIGKTKSDAEWTKAMPRVGAKVIARWHRTEKGSVIFTFIGQPAEE